MYIRREFRDAMLQHAAEEHPNECCGILGVLRGKVEAHYRIKNTHPSPYRYEMDAKEFLGPYLAIQDAGWEPAFYHSHSHSPAFPSATDIRLVGFPDSFYLIVAPHEFDSNNQQVSDEPQVRAFLIKDSEVTEEPVLFRDPIYDERAVELQRQRSAYWKLRAPSERS